MGKYLYTIVVLALAAVESYAAPSQAQLSVWANEAIVATYSYSYKNYLQAQKQIAQYFTAQGWIEYSKALNDSKLPQVVQKNNYDVSAVATAPPKMISLDDSHWVATMPLLVLYASEKSQQQQHLKVVIQFSSAPEGQGVRGFYITSLKSILSEPPCECVVNEQKKKK